MCCLSMLSAYNFDLKLPDWLGSAIGGRLGPNPLMFTFVAVCVAGAVVAAALPLTETTLTLYNSRTRQEVRLSDGRGFMREASHDPQRPSRWMPVCDGGWLTLPPDLKALRGQRAHHAIFVAVAVAWTASRLARHWQVEAA